MECGMWDVGGPQWGRVRWVGCRQKNICGVNNFAFRPYDLKWNSTYWQSAG